MVECHKCPNCGSVDIEVSYKDGVYRSYYILCGDCWKESSEYHVPRDRENTDKIAELKEALYTAAEYCEEDSSDEIYDEYLECHNRLLEYVANLTGYVFGE